jgi:hypothetical protein
VISLLGEGGYGPPPFAGLVNAVGSEHSLTPLRVDTPSSPVARTADVGVVSSGTSTGVLDSVNGGKKDYC